MAHTRPTELHVTHPLARAAGVDIAIIVFTFLAALMTVATGQDVPNWQNIVFSPLVMLLAAVALMLCYVEIRMFIRNSKTTTHRGTAVLEVMVPVAVTVIAGPMLLIMPFVFFGALAR